MNDLREQAEKTIVRWGVLWSSRNKQEGYQSHFMFEDCLPVLFNKKRDAQSWIDTKYGYMRKDTHLYLRKEPFGWMLPKPIRVAVRLQVELLAEKQKESR